MCIIYLEPTLRILAQKNEKEVEKLIQSGEIKKNRFRSKIFKNSRWVALKWKKQKLDVEYATD